MYYPLIPPNERTEIEHFKFFQEFIRNPEHAEYLRQHAPISLDFWKDL